MTGAAGIPALAAVVVSVLLIGGAGLTLIGAFGLLSLRQSFYQRVHAPTLGTTLGTASIAFASMIYFSALEGRLLVHELLIVVLITVTTPISLMVLVRAAALRDTVEKENESSRAVDGERR
jgi:multicomponent K+:H+ antiporter subunit G